MERNLTVHETDMNLEDFIAQIKDRNFQKGKIYGSDCFYDDEMMIIDNLKDNQLGEEIVSLIQKGEKDFLLLISSSKIFELRPEFEALKQYLISVKSNGDIVSIAF